MGVLWLYRVVKKEDEVGFGFGKKQIKRLGKLLVLSF
jgi:hypothetical protein